MHLQSDANSGWNGGSSSSYLVILCYLIHFFQIRYVLLVFDSSCYSYFMLNLCLVVVSLLSLAAALHIPLHFEDVPAPVDNNPELDKT